MISNTTCKGADYAGKHKEQTVQSTHIEMVHSSPNNWPLLLNANAACTGQSVQ